MKEVDPKSMTHKTKVAWSGLYSKSFCCGSNSDFDTNICIIKKKHRKSMYFFTSWKEMFFSKPKAYFPRGKIQHPEL